MFENEFSNTLNKMDTKNIFSPVNRQDYFEGYSTGLNPFLQVNDQKRSKAFISGFNLGRLNYESLNGCICDGIPERIITNKVLEDFLLAGLIGLNVDTDGYTPFQLNTLAKWYQSGTENYNPKQSLYLFEILEMNGIQIN